MCCGVVGGGGLCVFIRIYIDVDTGELARTLIGQDTLAIFWHLWTPLHMLAFVDSYSYFGFCGLLLIFWHLWTLIPEA